MASGSDKTLEDKWTMEIDWMDSKMKKTEIVVYPKKAGTVSAVCDEVRKLIGLSENGSGKLRMLEISSHKILRTCDPDQCIDELMLTSKIYRVEEIPIDQVEIDPKTECLMPFAHFDKEPRNRFGDPFYMKVKSDETLAVVFGRVQKLLEIPDKEFEEYKFALAHLREPKYIEKDKLEDTYLDFSAHDVARLLHYPESWMGLDHADPSPFAHQMFPFGRYVFLPSKREISTSVKATTMSQDICGFRGTQKLEKLVAYIEGPSKVGAEMKKSLKGGKKAKKNRKTKGNNDSSGSKSASNENLSTTKSIIEESKTALVDAKGATASRSTSIANVGNLEDEKPSPLINDASGSGAPILKENPINEPPKKKLTIRLKNAKPPAPQEIPNDALPESTTAAILNDRRILAQLKAQVDTYLTQTDEFSTYLATNVRELESIQISSELRNKLLEGREKLNLIMCLLENQVNFSY